MKFKYLFFIILLSFFGISSAFSKSVQKDAQQIGFSHFELEAVGKSLRSNNDNILISLLQRKFKKMGPMKTSGGSQVAYISVTPDFLMATIQKSKSDNIIWISITKYEKQVPFKDLKYFAYDSRKVNQKGLKGRMFFLGNGNIEGQSVKFILSTNSFTQSGQKQITWTTARR
jgi:hypothetical protein